MKFRIIYISFFVLFATSIQAQNIKKSYIDIIDYLKIEKFNKKVKEVITEHTEYDNYSSRDKNVQKIKNYTKSKQIFDKFGCIISQIDQTKSYAYFGSKNQNKYTKINYVYDTKHKLLKEKIYKNLDTITLQPIDTSKYCLKIYKYDIHQPLKEILEYNESKVLVKKTNFSIDTIKFTLELSSYNLEPNNNYKFKTDYKFDENSLLTEQTFYQNGKISGISYVSYDEKGRKSKIAFSSATSMFESVETFIYDNNGFLVESRNGSNLDPGTKKYYTYTFDVNKNWLTKEIKNDKGIVTESFKRKLTYFK